jgi:nitrite reductase/ring-hydroxylating ferredoxin subunit
MQESASTAAGHLPAQAPDAISRREAVQRAAGAALCACCAGLATGCTDRDEAQTASTAPAARYPAEPAGPQMVATLDQLNNETPARFEIAGIPVFLLKATDTAGGVYVIVMDGRCPHARCRISYLPVVVPASGGPAIGGNFRCPCHGSTFTKMGERLSGPAKRNLRSVWYEVRGEGEVWVDLGRELQESTRSPLAPAETR